MTEMVVEIRQPKTGSQHTLGLDKGLRDALADYARRRWPSNTAKLMAREWDLSLDEARGVVACRTSLATIERIIKRSGWTVLLPVMADVIGTGVDTFIETERRRHDDQASRLRALGRDLRPVDAVRRDGSVELAAAQDGRDQSEHRRASQG